MNVVLARLLTPSEYGVIAMVVAVSGFVLIFQDFGLSGAALQARGLSQSEASTLFYLSSGLGAVFAITLVLGAPTLADFYNEPRVVHAASVLSISFLLTGLASQFAVQNLRAMRFSSVATAELMGTLITAASSIALALSGLSYWSVAIGSVCGSLTRLIILASTARWLPGRPAALRRISHLAKVGGAVAATQALNYSSQAVDTMLVGRFQGTRDAAYYSRAYFLALFPMQQLTGPLYNVVVATLSVRRDDAESLRRALRTIVSALGYVVLPAYALLASTAGDIVALLLGDNWDPVTILVQILCIAGAARLFANILGWLALITERTRRQLWFTGVSTMCTLCALVVGVEFGTAGVAWAYSVSAVVLVPLGFSWILRHSTVPPMVIARAAIRPGLVSLLVLAGGFSVQHATAEQDIVLRLAATVACWPGGVAVASLLASVRSDIRALAGLLRSGVREVD